LGDAGGELELAATPVGAAEGRRRRGERALWVRLSRRDLDGKHRGKMANLMVGILAAGAG
jgi:hypothetical protein